MRNSKGQFIKGSNEGIGRHHTSATKEKLRQSHLGKSLSEEHKLAISKANKGGNSGSFQKGVPSWKKGTGEPLEGRKECPICHKIFFYKRAFYNPPPKTCSKECRYKSCSITGTHQVKCICVICKNEFYLPPSWIKKRSKNDGSYCSKECRWKNTRMRWTENEKENARRLVRVLTNKGIIKKCPCIVCGVNEVENHHYKGYEKEHWLDIKWLCRLHHMQEHERMRRTGESLVL